MIEGLMWVGLDLAEVEDRVPSWSWTSIGGIPSFCLEGEWEPLASVIATHVELQGSNEFGAVRSASIKMEAPVVPVVLVSSRKDFWTPIQAFRHVRGIYSSARRVALSAGSIAKFDFVGKRHCRGRGLS